MLKVVFFARLREQLGLDEIEWPWQPGMSITTLREQLQGQGQPWHDLLASPSLLSARNQEMASADTLLEENDEVAFFPPVTGG